MHTFVVIDIKNILSMSIDFSPSSFFYYRGIYIMLHIDDFSHLNSSDDTIILEKLVLSMMKTVEIFFKDLYYKSTKNLSNTCMILLSNNICVPKASKCLILFLFVFTTVRYLVSQCPLISFFLKKI